MSTLATFIQHILGSPRHNNHRRKRNKNNPIGKVKLSLFTDGTILYIGNPKGVIRKLPGLISAFSKVTGYSVNVEKPVEFLHINNKTLER